MDVSTLPFTTNSISIYKYEPFWYRILRPVGASGLSSTVSPGIPSSFLDVSTIRADLSSTSGYNGATSTVESWIVNALDGSGVILGISSNPVSIFPGRFLDSNSNSMSNNSFSLYLKEPFTPVLFRSFINLQAPLIVSPTLPPGISFVPSGASNYYLTASPSPSVVLPTTNYQIVGRGTGSDVGKIVTTRVNLTVGQERILLDLSGSSIVGPMTIGDPITGAQVTARYPPYQSPSSNLRYTWNALPDGLAFANLSGVGQTSPFVPTDASSSIVLKGIPTVDAAKSFANARITTYTATLTGTRINVAPAISASQSFSFSFVRSVLFDDVTVPPLFRNVPLDPTKTVFRAHTYFGANDASMTSIISPDLRSDLSLVFISNQQAAYLFGEPLSSSTGNYIIRATNTLGDFRDLSVNITSSDVSANYDYTVTPPNNTASFTFVVSRPLSNALPPYYTSPILFKASNSANLPMTYTASTLPIGLSISNIGGNVGQLVGSPGAPFPEADVDISASITGSSVSISTRLKITTISDVYTFSYPTPLTIIQNRTVTPFQISATALSERTVIWYDSFNLPSNLTMTNRGIVSGINFRPERDSFEVTASTGYTTGIGTIPFTLVPDNFVLFVDDPLYLPDPAAFSIQIFPGQPVYIPIRGLSFSGIKVNKYQIYSDPPSEPDPLVIDFTTGDMTAATGVYVPPAEGVYTYYIYGASTFAAPDVGAGQLKMILTVGSGSEPTIVQINIYDANDTDRPVFTSPADNNILLYQYAFMKPIVLDAATEYPPIRFYVAIDDLPIGITYDATTRTISGRPAFTGTNEVIVYANDDNAGFRATVLKFTVVMPSVLRQQTSAGAYTSLVRQYVNVNAAQNARDNRVFPTAERSLGEFMSPQAPDVVTAVPPCVTVRKTAPYVPELILPNYYDVGPTFWSVYWYPYLTKIILPNSSAVVAATRSTMGATLTDASKYRGGVLAPNGKIYGIPSNSSTILIIDPATNTATRGTMGATLTGTAKYSGGVLAPNGKIYGVPYATGTILIIDPGAGTATTSTMGATLTGSNKWYGGVLAPNGKIYCIPSSSTDILIIDPATNTATQTTMGLTLSGSNSKWFGGVLAPNGKIYCIPGLSTDILVIDPATDTAMLTSVSAILTGTFKWWGGVLARDGKIYGIPYDATDILIIDPGAGTATTSAMGATLTGTAKWSGGVLGLNGKIYGFPANSTDILIIDPGAGTATTTTMGATLTGTTKWLGGVLGPNGTIYGIPFTSTDILQLTPTPTPVFDIKLALTPYFNK